ncbi:MAG: ATP-binding cassette domain-containing protein [Methylacidiphilaceae bacterium]|nr:ATP-binding cassette domain-containing protein [Candidatus Methylacidiphilaceae bacterium]
MVLRLVEVTKTLGTQHVLEGVNLEVAPRERLCIVGRSGAGKSVLLRLILGLSKPDSGEIWYGETNLVPLRDRELAPLRREMGMVFQNGALFDFMNVEDNVAFALRERRRPETEIREKVARILERLFLKGHEKKMPAELSGGMRKRVALARAIISRPKLIFYDEPTAGLDPIGSTEITDLIRCLNEEFGATTIVVTHDMRSVEQIAQQVAFLHAGRIYQACSAEEFLSSKDRVVNAFVHGLVEEATVGAG